MVGRFDGKVLVVTGGEGGISRADAERFASEGARVVLVDVDVAGLEQSASAVERAGGEGAGHSRRRHARRRGAALCGGDTRPFRRDRLLPQQRGSSATSRP
jgi:NAD(P)-dependent dehydrogenase (short-subunit alcohol dehydrogenase family)